MTALAQWSRPFNTSYSSHTACFFTIQILTLSRVFAAIETEYTLKLRFLLLCDVLAVAIVVFGIIRTFPYIKQVFQAQEIVVNNGPSLITELIPNFILSFVILSISVALFAADYSIWKIIDFKTARFIYFFIGFAGLVFSILSVHDSRERVIASTTMVTCTLSGAKWFSDFGLIVPVSIACSLLAFIAARESQNRSNLYIQTETEVLRVKALFLSILALSMLTSIVQPFGIMSLLAVFLCNGILYIQERRLGSLFERQFTTTV